MISWRGTSGRGDGWLRSAGVGAGPAPGRCGGGVLLEQDPGAVIAQASPAGVRAGVAARDGAPGQAARRGDRCGRSASARPWVMYRTSRFELPGSRVPDLPQQPLDRHRGVLGAALAQVVAVGVDERGPVLRGAPQPLGLLCAGVALDRAQGQVQAAGAFQQVPLPSRSWSCCQRSRVVSARFPRCGGAAPAQHAECSATSLCAASVRPCHRCQRSLTWTAPGRTRRTASRRRRSRRGTRPGRRDDCAAIPRRRPRCGPAGRRRAARSRRR